MNPGQLRERVEVLTSTRVNTPAGTKTTWDVTATRWAGVTQVGARATAMYGTAGVSEVTHEVTLRPGATASLGGVLFRWRNSIILQPQAPPLEKGGRVIIPCKQLAEVPGDEA